MERGKGGGGGGRKGQHFVATRLHMSKADRELPPLYTPCSLLIRENFVACSLRCFISGSHGMWQLRQLYAWHVGRGAGVDWTCHFSKQLSSG